MFISLFALQKSHRIRETAITKKRKNINEFKTSK